MKSSVAGLDYEIGLEAVALERETVVLAIHGRPVDRRSLLPIREWAIGTGFGYVSYDQYGSGETTASVPVSDDDLLEHLVRELSCVLGWVCERHRVVLWAHSMGGILAARALAGGFPGVEAAIFSGFCPFRKEFEQFNERRLAEIGGSDPWPEFNRLYICRVDPWPPDFRDSMANRAYGTISLTGDESCYLNRLDLSVLLLRGEYDLCSSEQTALTQNSIKNAASVVIPEASHYPFIERPVPTFSAANEFLASALKRKTLGDLTAGRGSG